MSQRTSLNARFDSVAAAIKPSKPFMVVDGKIFTYGQALDRISRLNGYFRDCLDPGEVIGILTASPEITACLLLAAIRSGHPVISLNPDLTPPEVRHALTAARVDHVFADKSILESGPVPSGVASTPIMLQGNTGGLFSRLVGRTTATADPSGLLARLAATEPLEHSSQVDPEDTALMLFTSGTTDHAKVVELSHRNLAAQFSAFDAVYDYDAQSRILNPLPLHFTDGIMHGPLVAFLSQATLVRPKTFHVTELEALLDTVHRERVTHFTVVPTLLAMIDRLVGDRDDAFETPHFRFIRSSGDRLPDKLWGDFQKRFGVRVMNTYGMSETVCEALFCGPDDIRIGTVGRPVECEIDIVSDVGNSVADGLTGELMVRGDLTMKGYLGRPDLTEQAFSGEWLKTGDLAVRSPDGFVTINGRTKDTVVTGGMNVDPKEVANVLNMHENVEEAAACGLSDAVMGEIVVAAIVPRRGADVPDEASLIAWCRDSLAEYKRPRRIVAVDALPRTSSGKLKVSEVRDLVAMANRGSAVHADDLEMKIIEKAGEIFGVPPERLSRASTPENSPGWDSFAHISLSMAVESIGNTRFSPRDILAASSLGDFVDIVERRSSTSDTSH